MTDFHSSPKSPFQRAAASLLEWYDRSRRDLPWRADTDPYRVWISEVMLQQTQVSVVIPYYIDFLESFPTVEILAAAPLEDVLAKWSGLGYYRRARQMHEAAREIARRGGFPSHAKALRELPGFGPYTSAAVASISFGERVAALDGNLERVLCRLHAIAENPKTMAVRRRLVAAAEELLDPYRPGDSNQALMELGATLCRPKRPKCLLCPLQEECIGRRGDPESFPPPRQRRKTEKVEWTVALVRRGHRVLFFRRPDDSSLLAGLWELPNVDASEPRSAEEALTARYGGGWRLEDREATVRHSITFRSISLHVHPASYVADPKPKNLESTWIDPTECRVLGISSMFEKAVNVLGEKENLHKNKKKEKK